ncbi:hypothetical protein KZX49_19910 [Klebsiella quasipneumoniae]|uniref:hypothetical protein n=1 Tax=Klebsiella quasipneumoniae TaxID=1463165 RepID=UPI000A0F1F87|nr:hypothetical protein [Klebsiella quasipneumoniae]HBT4714411.1 hypothetical protein [Klebsiella quasipneumoniae subsp. quasipneumoniae]MDH1961971.1 hypothetical protein [Klebsiella quasipneumoniae]MEC5638857.1 hypothetical protein [Klebsiella quasipneumoniae]QYD20255.1 hypothetical protein KZX49_19910 [Klebsiella quasipneumoniae]SMG70516.1 Uncharacterised protein [Klebsiella quasipneumoniae]
MNIKFVTISVFAVVFVFVSDISIAKSNALSDDQVRQRIIDDSVASYPGTCACPFNTARSGSSCGGRSAWSKAGGYSPICYKKEVTKEMVKAWRQENQ